MKNYYGKKVKLDGYTFDSRKEASFYVAYIKSCGKKYQVHPQYELLPIYNAGEVRVGGIYYRPDFVVYGVDGAIEHVYELPIEQPTRAHSSDLSYSGASTASRLRW